ncbi:MAG: heavy metal-binding domain-containing protein [Myxococcota bacterium]
MNTPIAFKLASIGALLGACSAGPIPVSHSPGDPASPAAPEGTNPLIASAAAPKHAADPAPSEHDHGEHEHGAHDHGAMPAPMPSAPAPAANGTTPPAAAEGVTYVCPMHPEVTSNAPGVCPKCGMKLVPKK